MQIYRQTNNSAGADLSASEEVVIYAGEIVLVPTGYYLDNTTGGSFCGGVFSRVFNEAVTNSNIFYLLAARSSLAYKKGLLLANGVGIIDSDYKDEIKVVLYNSTKETVIISKGERIAQLIPTNYLPIFPSLDNERSGGFGSTGE